MADPMGDPDEAEERHRRRKYETRVALAVFATAFMLLSGIALIYVADFFQSGIDRIGKMIEASSDPSINVYYEENLPQAFVPGVVTAIVPREDKMPDGQERVNYYARTEYRYEPAGANCYFHYYLGPNQPARYEAGQSVTVAYQPQASDPCGSSMIDE